MNLLLAQAHVDLPVYVRERAEHTVHIDKDELSTELSEQVSSLRPRTVGVVDAPAIAAALTDAGHEVTLFQFEDKASVVVRDNLEVTPLVDHGEAMDVHDDITATIGNTPLVRIDRMARDVRPQVIAKIESLNPGGSIKDRPALTMVEDAERRGLLKPGGTIVEPTSGNTGVGLAITAARKGYRCVFVAPDKVSQEKINQLRAYGAEVVVCPTAVSPEDPRSYYSVSDRLAREIPGAYKPDQYKNPANTQAHVESTGPEIWRQTVGRVTHVVAGVGTAGTIVGISRYLKSKNPDIQIIGADPEGSVYSGGTGRPYLVEGVGEDFFPGNYDASAIDRVMAVSDANSFETARRITREEGIFTGGSGGMAVYAAIELSKELSRDDVVVVVLPDSGRGYLSKVFSDEWLAGHGFSQTEGVTIADVLKAKSGEIPELVHVHPEETARQVSSTMREFGVSSVVVVNAEPPLMMGEVVGSTSEEALLRVAVDDQSALDQPIGELMGPIPQVIGTGESIGSAIEKFDDTSLLIAVESGRPVGIITRTDLLDHLASR